MGEDLADFTLEGRLLVLKLWLRGATLWFGETIVFQFGATHDLGAITLTFGGDTALSFWVAPVQRPKQLVPVSRYGLNWHLAPLESSLVSRGGIRVLPLAVSLKVLVFLLPAEAAVLDQVPKGGTKVKKSKL